MPGPTMEAELPIEPQSLKKLSLKRSLDLFSPLHGQFPPPDPESKKIRVSHKLNTEHPAAARTQAQQAIDIQRGFQRDLATSSTGQPRESTDYSGGFQGRSITKAHSSSERNLSTSAIMERIPRPERHAPWKNYRVISGHKGSVRSVAVDPSNSWFCTGSADQTIKIWDLATGVLKLTLTGHIGQVRALAVSKTHTYMFSSGADKLVNCWDLEQNKVIRSYHGHLSGVYCLALHPTIDVLLTGGRDSVCRVWDIRSKTQVFALSGHDNTVCSVFARPTDPQVITASHDSTIKLWDLRYGKTMSTLTHHKKSVRAMAPHPTEDCFVSASAQQVIMEACGFGTGRLVTIFSKPKQLFNPDRSIVKLVYMPSPMISPAPDSSLVRRIKQSRCGNNMKIIQREIEGPRKRFVFL